MADFVIKRNDNRPDLEAQLKSGGSVVDLSNATSVMFHLCEERNKASQILSSAATITDAGNGKVKYEWKTGDTDRTTDIYFFEFEVEWSNGDLQTFPNNGFKSLRIAREGG